MPRHRPRARGPDRPRHRRGRQRLDRRDGGGRRARAGRARGALREPRLLACEQPRADDLRRALRPPAQPRHRDPRGHLRRARRHDGRPAGHRLRRASARSCPTAGCTRRSAASRARCARSARRSGPSGSASAARSSASASWPRRPTSARRTPTGSRARSCSLRREALEAAGWLDERFFMSSEETDLCFRVKAAGFGVVHLPSMTILHHAGKRGTNPRMDAQYAFARRLFARKHLAPGARTAYLAALGLRYGLRAVAPDRPSEVNGDGALRRESAKLSLQTLAGLRPPPFGAPPPFAVAPRQDASGRSPGAGEAPSPGSRPGSRDPIREVPDAEAVQRGRQPRHPRLDADWDAFLARRRRRQGAPERARRPLRRHRAARRGRRTAGGSTCRRWTGWPTNGLTYSQWHTTALCSPTRSSLPHRAQPPPERLRVDLRDRRPGSPATTRTSRRRTRRWRRSCATRAGARSGSARTTTSPSTSGRWARRRRTGRSARATTASTASSAARRTSGIPTSPRTTTTSISRTCPRTATTSPRTWPTRRSSFIRDSKQSEPDKPWYLWFCPGANHAPHHAPQEYIDKYKGKFDDGYEAYREWVLPRMIERGILPEGTELTPINPMPEGTFSAGRRGAPVGHALRRREAAVLPDGRGLCRLQRVHRRTRSGGSSTTSRSPGQLDNTLILYCADNGASGEGSPNGSVNEDKFFNG